MMHDDYDAFAQQCISLRDVSLRDVCKEVTLCGQHHWKNGGKWKKIEVPKFSEKYFLNYVENFCPAPLRWW